jgi:hypothetical protein
VVPAMGRGQDWGWAVDGVVEAVAVAGNGWRVVEDVEGEVVG